MATALPLPKDRILHLASQVDQESIEKITEKILEINDSDEDIDTQYSLYNLVYTPEPIRLYIDSYGGNVYQGLGLIGVIEKSKTPVHTYVTGTAMSCGFMILISGHYRYAYPYATVMYHQISDWLRGTITDIKQDLVEGERLQALFETLVTKKTRIKKEALRKTREMKQDWYMSAQQALRYGVIDSIL